MTEQQATPLPIYSVNQLNELPDPVWQVDGLMVRRSLTGIYGPTGHGKTFVALHVALCMAIGMPFLGRSVVRGNVVYVYAEGAPNLKYRVKVWQAHHGLGGEEPSNIWFIPTAVNLMDPKARGLKDLLETVRPTTPEVDLVILDTLARCFGGGDEDATQQMNSFTNRCAILRDKLDCTVVVVHHTGHNKSRERGNRALRSNFDTFIRCSKHSDRDSLITLACEKQKDAPPFEAIKLRLHEVPVGGGTSCIVRLDDNAPEHRAALSSQMRNQLAALSSFGHGGATFVEWKEAALEAGISESAFKRNRPDLIGAALVTSPPEDTPTRGFKYQLTSAGRATLGGPELDEPEG